MRKKGTNWISRVVGGYWLFGISLIMLGGALASNISHNVITDESVVLVFVGILATFVVVGNYAQVKSIEEKMEKKFEFLDEKTKELENINTDLNDIRSHYEDIIKAELRKIQNRFLENHNHEELKKNLAVYKDVKNEVILDEVFNIIPKLSVFPLILRKHEREAISYTRSLVIDFLPDSLDKNTFIKLGKKAIDLAYDLTRTIDISKLASPARDSLFIVKYVYMVAERKSYGELREKTFFFYEELSELITEENSDLRQLMEIYKEDLSNLSISPPIIHDKELLARLEEEKKKLNDES